MHHLAGWRASPSRIDCLDAGEAPLEAWGPELRIHPAFGAEGRNVDVVDEAGNLRTWERGVEGETLACGSGAIAAAAALLQSVASPDGAKETTLVPASGVPLRVRIEGASTRLTGDARILWRGAMPDEATEGF